MSGVKTVMCCVVTTCGRILLHRHASCTQAATRYGLDSEQNSHLTGVPTSPKKRFYLTSSLCFLCAHEASYVWVSFCAHMYACDILQWDPWQRASYDLPYEREGALHRHVQEVRWGTPVQATCACPWKKIFSYVRTQETQRNHRTKDLLWVCIHTQRDCGFEHAEKHDGFGRAWNCKVCTPDSEQVMYEHILVLIPGLFPTVYVNNPSWHASALICMKVWMTWNKKIVSITEVECLLFLINLWS